VRVVIHASVGRLVAASKAAGLTPLPSGGEWTFRCPACEGSRITLALTRGGAVELTCAGHHGGEVVLEALRLDRRPGAPAKGAA
jgi:hypothetical protein